MALNPGDTLLNDRYRISRQLGRGGFGFVYEAHDMLLGEEVTIKELIPALVGDEAMLKRFLAEAKATRHLTHRRIVRTHNVFSEGGSYYIVMQYMPGGSLEERLRKQGPVPMSEAVRIPAEGTPLITVARNRLHTSCIDLPVVSRSQCWTVANLNVWRRYRDQNSRRANGRCTNHHRQDHKVA